MNFNARVAQTIAQTGSLLCVGLDPDPALMPESYARGKDFYAWGKQIIDAVHESVAAFKPQIAFYAAYGREEDLSKTIAYIKDKYPQKLVILDAKRSDIGNTARLYAHEAFDRFRADAVTVNPLMGSDSILPFVDYSPDRGCFVLCHTSNPGAKDLLGQNLEGGQTLAEHIAGLAIGSWNRQSNLGLVVGATYPEALKKIRQIVGEPMPFLVPGVGAQGGDLQAVLGAALNQDRAGVLINVSRAVLFAGKDQEFAQAAKKSSSQFHQQINAFRRNV